MQITQSHTDGFMGYVRKRQWDRVVEYAMDIAHTGDVQVNVEETKHPYTVLNGQVRLCRLWQVVAGCAGCGRC